MCQPIRREFLLINGAETTRSTRRLHRCCLQTDFNISIDTLQIRQIVPAGLDTGVCL